jgi:hypothetical protein
MNWTPIVIVVGLVAFFWPTPFGRFAPYGSWQFVVGVAIWGGLAVGFVIVKLRSPKRANSTADETTPPSAMPSSGQEKKP